MAKSNKKEKFKFLVTFSTPLKREQQKSITFFQIITKKSKVLYLLTIKRFKRSYLVFDESAAKSIVVFLNEHSHQAFLPYS